MPGLRGNLNPHRKVAGRLIAFGGWLTVSNIIAPLMGSFDRFLLGALVSVSAVAFYSTPYEMVTKMWLLPTALTGVLFPAFSASFAQDKGRCELLYQRGVKYIFLSLFPAVLIIVTFAGEGMTLWLGREFSANSYKTLQWLAAGVFINSISHIPATFINGCGRPDITTKLNLLELPLYLAGAWFLASRYGINGMAMAWTLRATVDCLILFMIVRRFLKNLHDYNWFALRSVFLPLCLFAVAASLAGLVSKILFLSFVLGVFVLVVWRSMLVEDEKIMVCKFLRFSRT
jgi:O-antigen/teichoic acid export membrane protein